LKRIFSYLLIALMMFSSVGMREAKAETIFTDLGNYSWADEAIYYLYDKKIIGGYGNGLFGPGDNITREQAALMLVRELYPNEKSKTKLEFTDVSSTSDYYNAIAVAVDHKLFGGYDDNTFKPGNQITRAETAKILTVAYGLTGDNADFIDTADAPWAKDFINALASNRIALGYPDRTFKPNNSISRAEFSLLVARVLDDRFKQEPAESTPAEQEPAEVNPVDPQNPTEQEQAPYEPVPTEPLPEMKVSFLDVGEGDAILIEYANGKKTLIDAGRSDSVIESALAAEGVTHIDTLIATHPDADHIGGADYVIQNYGVTKVIDSGQVHTTRAFTDYLQAADTSGASFEIAEIGDNLSDDPNAKANVLFVDHQAAELNDGSIVIKLSYGDVSFLLTGDAGHKVENELMNQYSYQELQANFLKASHHGSNTGTSRDFLSAVAAGGVILSYGENPYGHPSEEVLRDLLDYGAEIYSTFYQGTVSFGTDGQSTLLYDYIEEPFYTLEPIPHPYLYRVDLDNEYVLIHNDTNEAVDMSGWYVISVEGNQKYVFPNGTVIQPRDDISVVSGPEAFAGEDQFVWTTESIWNNSGDPALLYNAKGELMSEIR